MLDDLKAKKPLSVQFCQMIFAMQDGHGHTAIVDRQGNFIPLPERLVPKDAEPVGIMLNERGKFSSEADSQPQEKTQN